MKTSLIIILILSLSLIYVGVMQIFAYYGIAVFLIGATFEAIEIAKKKRL